MNHSHDATAILGAYFTGNPRVIGAGEQEAPLVMLPTAYFVALSAVVLLGIASAAW